MVKDLQRLWRKAFKIADELGFKTVNLDNYCGYAEMGEGEEIVGIAGHLDIVPVGGDWTYDPLLLPVMETMFMDVVRQMIRDRSWRHFMQ